MSRPRLIVISGLSGAGKSCALKALEDVGYYCVDNLPPQLIPTFIELCSRAKPRVTELAMAVDARTPFFREQCALAWPDIREREPTARLLFFDARDDVITRRFSETRRPHPLAGHGFVLDGIRAEREMLAPVRDLADHVIDTSALTSNGLREFIVGRFSAGERPLLNLAVASFGFKNGVLANADLVFDVRFLPNPHYDSQLRPLTGLDAPVRDFVESHPDTVEFLDRVEGLLGFLIPRYAREGKSYLTIAFGCTGGRHRSVAIAANMASRLTVFGYPLAVTHFDLEETGSSRSASR